MLHGSSDKRTQSRVSWPLTLQLKFARYHVRQVVFLKKGIDILDHYNNNNNNNFNFTKNWLASWKPQQ